MKNFATSWRGVVVLVVMWAMIAIIYGSGLRHGYVFDDLRLADGTIVLTEPYSLSLSFRSLWNASYPWIHQTFGSDVVWQRGFNVVLHAVNAVLLWALCSRLLERALHEQDALGQRDGGVCGDRVGMIRAHRDALAPVAVQIGVLLWAANPVAVYAVAYLIQRSTLMATGFMLVSLLTFIEALRSRRWLWFVATALSYGLLLMSKEHGAPMVAVLLPLYIWWQRPARATLWRSMLLLSVVAIVVAAGVFKLKGWVLGAATEDMVEPFLQQLAAIDPAARERVFALSVINQAWLYFRYGVLWLIPWPGWLSIDIRVPFPTSWWSLYLLGAMLFLAMVAWSIWLILARRGLPSLLGLVLLAPALLYVTEFAYVRLQEPFVLYRSYLWSVTLPLLWAMALLLLFRSRQSIYGVGYVLAFVFAAMAFERVQSFRDELTVWRDANQKLDIDAPPQVLGRWRAPLNLSRVLLSRGDNEEALRMATLSDKLGSPLGLAKFNQAAALMNMGNPGLALSLYYQADREGFNLKDHLHRNRGLALARMGRTDEALSDFDEAAKITKSDAMRAEVLLAAARAANAGAQYDRAINYYERLKVMHPELTAVPIGISYALYKKGRLSDALGVLNQALAKRPTADLLHARSYLFYQMGNAVRALADIEVALAIDPKNPLYQSLQRQIKSGVAVTTLGSMLQ